MNILYEDNHIIVVEKPRNMPVQADSSGDPDLLAALKTYIKEKYEKPGDVFLGLVHRLDRPVGGVMVFARTSKAAARLSVQFQSREVRKHYIAIVTGETPPDVQYRDYIDAQEGEKRVRVYEAPTPGAKEAVLRFHTIAHRDGLSLIDIELLTGRKHQIRAQMAAHDYPIRCDQRYHPHPEKGPIALYAYALSILHPTRKERLFFTNIPRFGAFETFSVEVCALGAHEAGYALYADNALLVCDKQPGTEVTRIDGGEASLQARMEPCFGTLFPVHRIDANTRGLVLFGHTQEAGEAFDAALRNGQIEKYYHCLVRGTPMPERVTLEAFARKEDGRLIIKEHPFGGAVPIKTGYRVLEYRDDVTMLEVRLYTGRTHQIRAHMAFIGHPVLGDDKYGDYAFNKKMQMKIQALVAKQLTLHFPSDHPLAYLDGKTFHSNMEL